MFWFKYKEEVECLIELVRSKPEIYIRNSAKNDQVIEAWQFVAEGVKNATGHDVSVADCRVRWRSLLFSYKRIKKQDLLVQRGLATRKRETFKYREALKFMDEFLFTGVSQNGLENDFTSPSEPISYQHSPEEKGEESDLEQQVFFSSEQRTQQNSEPVRKKLKAKYYYEDENEAFCIDLYSRMSKFSPRQNSILKLQISTILYNVENPESPPVPVPHLP